MAGSTKGKKFKVYNWERTIEKKRYTVYINSCDNEKNALIECVTAKTATWQASRQFNFHKKRIDLLVLDNETKQIVKKYNRVF